MRPDPVDSGAFPAGNQGNRNYFSLGASGAVSAVLFAFILIQPWLSTPTEI